MRVRVAITVLGEGGGCWGRGEVRATVAEVRAAEEKVEEEEGERGGEGEGAGARGAAA